ncbi:MAG: ArsR/SmtB family transcription factor, partial [Candidatus Hodarchaeales archaeon]
SFQLSKKLKVSQKAVDKHIQILEKAGLISKYTEKSNIGPNRIYYTIKKSLSMTFGLSSNLYKVDFYNFPFNVIARIVIPSGDADEIEIDNMIAEQIRMNIIKSTELNNRINELTKVRKRLQFEREEALKIVLHYLNQLDIDQGLARSIISLIIKHNGEIKEDELFLPLKAERDEEEIRKTMDMFLDLGIVKQYKVEGEIWYVLRSENK